MSLQSFLTEIADAIREKTNTTEKINAKDFAAKIRNISSASTLLNYLESTGTQYIDTEIIPTADMGMRITYSVIQPGSAAVCGLFKGTSTTLANAFFISSNDGTTTTAPYVAHGTKGYVVDGSHVPLNRIATVMICYMGNGMIYFNDKPLGGTQTSSNFANASIPLFARLNVTNNHTACSSVRIYRVEITEQNRTTHKFVPALDGNNVPCMYDEITKKYHYNKGTGEFNYG